METYEEKYKDLVKRLNKAREEKGVYTFNSVLDAVAPELKIDESEDERIRKSLKDCFEWLRDDARWTDVYGSSFESVFDWLEKQGKNNMGISEATKKKLEDNLNKALEKETPESFNEFLDEQNPAWSEEDDNCLSTIIAEFSKCAGKSVSKDEWMRCNDFLNSLRDRVQSPPKQKWSEEDEKMIQYIINDIAIAQELVYCKSRCEDEITWLKSLKDRYTWKPSDEQMENLSRAFNGGTYRASLLMELYQDLKKLK